MCEDAIKAFEDRESEMTDILALLEIRYGLRDVGRRTEFYKMDSKDLMYAKMVLPTLKSRNAGVASEYLVRQMKKLQSHNIT